MSGLMIGPDGWLLVAAWGVVMVLVVWLLVREPRHSLERDEPGAILRARFARGELCEEEYRRAMSVLDSDPAPTEPTRRVHPQTPTGQETHHE